MNETVITDPRLPPGYWMSRLTSGRIALHRGISLVPYDNDPIEAALEDEKRSSLTHLTQGGTK